jgi:MFS transporter, DHA2 family, multidrug resistance protein
VTFIYRGAVTDAVGSDLPPDAIAAARDTLGGAHSAAEGLPDQLGMALITLSRNAFIEAFQTTALVSAAIALLAAAGTALILGRARQDSGLSSVSNAVES